MKSNNHRSITIVIGIVILLLFAITIINFSPTPMIVLSGSMEPIMMIGDMIITVPIEPEDIKLLDIITFSSITNPDAVVTHRVIAISNDTTGLTFKTKGDANEKIDVASVPELNVIGQTIFVIPFLGYLPEITKNQKIFFILVIIPSLILVIDEVLTIIKYSNPMKLRKLEKENKKTPRKIPRIVNWTLLISIIFITLIASMVLSLPYIADSCYTQPVSEYNVENNGLFTCSYTVLPSSINYVPMYGVIQPGNETLLLFTEEIRSTVSICPIFLPVFWVDIMAKINPVIPSLFIVIMFTVIVLFISIPLWYKKPKKRPTKSKVHK